MVLKRTIGQVLILLQFDSPNILNEELNFVTNKGKCINPEFVLFHDQD
jgi:hypothetical protein